MNILLTGATGYIGKRLLPLLIQQGHFVICCVRDKKRFPVSKSLSESVMVIEVDLLKKDTLQNIPLNIDGAYYLVHSMSASSEYTEMEKMAAKNFQSRMNATNVKHVIYLSGIVNEDKISKHLSSRKAVEDELAKGKYAFTTFRAGIIIGSGSASFEIIRDLVEKLPIMIAPKWLKTKCQPIGIRNVANILIKALFNKETFNRNFDIGDSDILTYKQMLLQYAEVRKLKRFIISFPVMTPRLSSYWLFFVTSTSYKLASALVDSMKIEVVCRNNDINAILDIKPYSYKEILMQAFDKIEQNQIISSWRDAFISSNSNFYISDFINVPKFGCYHYPVKRKIKNREKCIEKIWKIGGDTGWYYANWLWKIRGALDKITGGVGLKRGRTSADKINTGDSLDFWRVIFADKKAGRLLLYAEMNLPGEAWLDFKVDENNLYQTATFRPKGVWGRVYWALLYPFHLFIFPGIANALVK